MGGNDINEPKRRETRRLDPRYIFFSCFSYFLILNYCSIVNIGSYIRNTTRTGPNDARRVVWAIGKYFFVLFMFFVLKHTFIVYIATPEIHISCKLRKYATGREMEGGGDENEPKRRVSRRLGY